jgi:ArsR family transcriptional regulator
MENESAVFKVLADPTRLRLIVLLSIKGQTCVCKLAQALDAPDFKISRHLRIMRSAGLVEAKRQGTCMHYKLSKAHSKLEGCLQQCFKDCLAKHPTVKADMKRLSKSNCK